MEDFFFLLIVVLVLLSPIFLIRKIIGSKQKCPFCAEKIKKGASLCRHCGKEIPTTEKKQNAIVTGLKSGQAALSTEIKSSRESLFLFLSTFRKIIL